MCRIRQGIHFIDIFQEPQVEQSNKEPQAEAYSVGTCGLPGQQTLFVKPLENKALQPKRSNHSIGDVVSLHDAFR